MIAVFALNIERFVTFEKSYYNVSFPGNSIDCSKWYCTTDFTFTVLLLVNLGKKREYSGTALFWTHWRQSKCPD